VISVLALGAVHPPVQFALTAAFSLLVVFWCLAAALRRSELYWHPVLLLPLGLALLAWLQTVPLPRGLLALLSPGAEQAASALDGALGMTLESASISQDQGASAAAAVRWLGLSAGGALLIGAAASRRGRHNVRGAIVGLALFAVVLGVIQQLFGIERIYGLVPPQTTNVTAGIAGMFVAENHAAQFMLLGLMVWLASQVTQKTPSPVWIGVAVTLTLALGVTLTGSRASLVLALAGSTAILLAASRPGDDNTVRSRRAPFAFALVVGVTLATLAALILPDVDVLTEADTLAGQLHLYKLEYQQAGLEVLAGAPFAGIGADAFGAVQLALVPRRGPHFRFVENDFLQILVDFGLLLPVLLLAAVAILCRRRGPGRNRAGRRVWLIALLIVAAQSLVSFALTSLALSLAIWGAAAGSFTRPRPVHSKKLAVAIAVAVATSAALTLSAHPDVNATVDASTCAGATDEIGCLRGAAQASPRDGRALWRLVETSSDDALPALQGLAAHALELGAADPGLQLAGARYYRRIGDMSRAWPCIASVLDQRPGWPGTLNGWVGPTTSADELADAVARSPSLEEPLLEHLYRSGRYDLQLQLALAGDSAPVVVIHRVLASRALGEMTLARELSRSLEEWADTDPHACTTLIDLEYPAAPRPHEAIQALWACGVLFEDDTPRPERVRLMYRFVRWVSEEPEHFSDWEDERAEALTILSDSASRASWAETSYIGARGLIQARLGYCDLALESLAQAQFGVPGWVRSACAER